MKILFIDADSHKGHLNFNRIYINELQKYTSEIELCMEERYQKDLNLKFDFPLYVVPKRLYPSKHGKIKSRIFFLLRLLYIKRNISFKHYDYVIISSFEEISFYFSFCSQSNVILINHRNVVGLSSFVKRFFLKQISRKVFSFIVFEHYMKDAFLAYEIKNVFVVSHGMVEPFHVMKNKELISSFIPNVCQFKYIIFSPSSVSTDWEMLGNLVQSDLVNDFLLKNNILLVIKGKSQMLKTENKNIFVLEKYLSNEEYELLFTSSDLILLCYPPTFDFCVSGVLFECFSNNQPCILSDIRSFRAFEIYMNYNCFFSDHKKFVQNISLLLESPLNDNYLSLDTLKPDFSFLFQNEHR